MTPDAPTPPLAPSHAIASASSGPSAPSPRAPLADRADAIVALALLVGFSALYLAARQTNLTFDGAAALSRYRSFEEMPNPFHLAYGRALTACTRVGALFGISAGMSGLALAAIPMAGALAGLFALARALGAGRSSAALVACLAGLSATALENGTSVEIYGCSALACVLAMHAGLADATRPSPRSALFLWLACVVVLCLHLGYAFLVFALFVGRFLAEPRARRTPGRAAALLAAGAATIPPVALWIWLEGMLVPRSGEVTHHVFATFWRRESGLGLLARPLAASLFDFASYAGLAIAPAAFGWGVRRSPKRAEGAAFGDARDPARGRRYLRRVCLVATPCFLGVYAFWAVDLGSFYLPLALLWGVFGALGLDRLAERAPRPRAWMLPAGALAWFLAFQFVPLGAIGPSREPGEQTLNVAEGLAEAVPFRWKDPPRAALGACWIATVATAWSLARRWNRAAASDEASDGESAAHPAVALVPLSLAPFAVASIALTLVAYGPRVIQLKSPDETLRFARAFAALAPERARLVTMLATPRVEVESGRETLAAFLGENHPPSMAANRATFSRWLEEMARDPARGVWLDAASRDRLAFLAGDENSRATAPLDRIEWLPREAGGFQFFKARMRSSATPST